ncbi:trypsin-like peptidase domain-containing protein [Dactylosporangium sp. NPDC049742]|uniref:P-loop NTPase n=1 Tax=Dactylosporangium sp. NPDC049742 TaxID=3154737 RepID=UPI0034385B61
MQRHRVVGVRQADLRGSGYLVAPRLILTSAHVCMDTDEPVSVVVLAEPETYRGVVVWRGTGKNGDAALVEITDPAWQPPAEAPTDLGRTVTYGAKIDCTTWGFPEWVRDAPEEGLESTLTAGKISAGDGVLGDRYVLRLDVAPRKPPSTRSAWAGMSGAAVFCGDLLAGVIAADPPLGGGKLLHAVPMYVLQRDPGFRQVLDGHGVAALLRPIETHQLSERDPQPGSSPAALLLARRHIVRFLGRDDLLAEMVTWAGGTGFGAWLLHGAGGQGKTRVAQELATRLADGRWATVWLLPDAQADALAVLPKVVTPMLLIVDYAESRIDQLEALLRAYVQQRPNGPVRLLLLARTDGDWWHSLRKMRGANARELLDGARVEQLGELEPQPAGQPTGYQQAITDLSDHIAAMPGYAAHDWATTAARLVAAAEPEPARVMALTVQLTALADLLDSIDPTARPAGYESVEDRVLTHEGSYWRVSARARGLDPDPGLATLEDILAATMLFGAESWTAADALLEHMPTLAGGPRSQIDRIHAWIGDLYPPADDRPWGGLQPDRLAERAAGLRLLRRPELIDKLLPVASAVQRAQLLTVYARAANQPAFSRRLDQHLADLVSRRPEHLAAIAIKVATQVERPEPLIRGVLVANATCTPALQATLVAALPAASLLLENLAAELFATHRRHAAETGDPDDEQHRRDNAMNARAESVSRAARGDRGEALDSAMTAVSIHQRLGVGRAGEFAADLALSLTNAAERLSDVGEHQRGLEHTEWAVALYRQHPRTERTALAAALVVRSWQQGRLGRSRPAYASAAKAVRIYRRSGGTEPADRAALAGALHALAHHGAAIGRDERSLALIDAALKLQHDLVEENPDAYRLDLAKFLHTKARVQTALGRRDDALKTLATAEEVYRILTGLAPTAFLPDRPAVVNSLAEQMCALGRRGMALEITKGVVQHYRRLVDEHPDQFLPDLAQALIGLSDRHADVGEHELALLAATEAEAVSSRAPYPHPNAEISASALVQRTLSLRYRDVGQFWRAYDAARGALHAHLALRRHLGGAVAAEVAASLTGAAERCLEVGDLPHGIEHAESAVFTYRTLALSRTGRHRAGLAMALGALARQEDGAGAQARARRFAGRAVRHWRSLVTPGSDAFRPELAAALVEQARLRGKARQHRRALAGVERATSLLRGLSTTNPVAFLGDLGAALTQRADLLCAAGRRTDGLAAADEALELLHAATMTQPAAFQPRLAAALTVRSGLLARLDRPEAALAAIDEAEAVYRDLVSAEQEALRQLAGNVPVRIDADHPPLQRTPPAVHPARREMPRGGGAFRAELVATAIDRSALLAAVGRHDDALAAADAALHRAHELEEHGERAIARLSAAALSNLARRHADRGSLHEAIRFAEDAIGAHRHASDPRGRVIGAEHPAALTEAAALFLQVGAHAQAARLSEQAMFHYRLLALRHPRAHRSGRAAARAVHRQAVAALRWRRPPALAGLRHGLTQAWWVLHNDLRLRAAARRDRWDRRSRRYREAWESAARDRAIRRDERRHMRRPAP